MKKEEQEFLLNYQQNLKDSYEKPSVACDLAIFTMNETKSENVRQKSTFNLEILLGKRDSYPQKDTWGLVGGFMGIEEELDETVARKLEEKTGIRNVYAEQLYTWSEINRDTRMRILSASYLALVEKEKLVVNDVEKYKLFNVDIKFSNEVDNITNVELILTSENNDITLHSILTITRQMFGKTAKEIIKIVKSDISLDHSKIILYSYLRLQNKIMYSPLAFNLVGDEFTLNNLQIVYETILQKELNNVTFRKFIRPMVIETGNMKSEGAFRPSKLYKYNDNWQLNMF